MFLQLLTVAALTAGEVPPFSLTWRVPCAPAPELTELVGAATGAAEVEVSNAERAWLLVVRFSGPVSGERRLAAETCEQAAQAAVVFIRLAARAAPREPLPIPVAELAQTSPPPVSAEPESPHFSLGLSALANAGPLPSVAARLGVTAGLEWPDRWLGLLSLRGGLPSVVSQGTAAVRVQPLIGAQLSACWQPRAGRFSGGPCGLVGAEIWQVTGENVARPRQGTAFPVVAGLEARGALALWEGLSLTAAIGGRVAIVRPSVFFEASGTVFQSSLFSAEGELGFRWVW